jgi:uncharacterized protein YegJ (DUF2314 family)
LYKLMNAKLQSKKYPESFEIPSMTEIKNLRSGSYVKLCFEEIGLNSERMWVKLTDIKGDNFHGILHNQPFGLTTVKHGDLVKFNSKHILSVM